MPSSYTDLQFELQAAGEHLNTWGADHLNNTIQRINNAIAGYQVVPITGDYTLTSSNSSTDPANFQSKNALLKFTGTLATAATITAPGVPMSWMIYNATNKALVVTTGSGDTVNIDAGDTIPVFCDAVNIRTLSYGSYTLKDYIAAQTASAGAVPGTVAQLGKFLKVTVDSAPPTWQQILSSDIGDIESYVRQKVLVYTLVFGGA